LIQFHSDSSDIVQRALKALTIAVNNRALSEHLFEFLIQGLSKMDWQSFSSFFSLHSLMLAFDL